MSSYSVSDTSTFTLTDARQMASKVRTDLKRLQRLYGKPTDLAIDLYEEEVIALLKNGYLKNVVYGFKTNGAWNEATLRYSSRDLIFSDVNDDPGGIRPRLNVDTTTFGSFLNYNSKWDTLSAAEKASFESGLRLKRSSGTEPGVNGYFSQDKTYSSGGQSLSRESVRSY